MSDRVPTDTTAGMYPRMHSICVHLCKAELKVRAWKGYTEREDSSVSLHFQKSLR